MIFDPPVLSLTEDAIGRIHLDADSLSAIWGGSFVQNNREIVTDFRTHSIHQMQGFIREW